RNGPLTVGFGVLDATGRASATFARPRGSAPTLAGIELHHAALVFDIPGSGAALFASNPVALDLIP
ncbi:MAG: hypothetical protein AAFZ65_19310, partial [Planctomycetota bacterium]